MSRKTLTDAKASRIPQTLGICADSDEFISILNEAIERLISRGHWKGSYQRIRLCVTDGCLTFPRQVASLSEVAVCGQPVSLRNQWWEFLKNTNHIYSEYECACPGPNFVDKGWMPTFNDVIPGSKQLRLYTTVNSDWGKKILLQGYDENNLWVRSQEAGEWIDGIYLTLGDPWVQSTFDWNSLTGLIKPLTDGDVLLYEVNTTNGDERLLGRYQPNETSPSWRRYHFRNLEGFCGSTCCSSGFTIEALAKLEFLPVSVDNDYLYIDNLPAIKEMCQAIRLAEMDNPQAQRQALVHEARALKELVNQQRNLSPDDTIATSLNVYGSARLSRHNIGRLM